MRNLKNKKGYTEAELMMVFALLALFGILCFTLIQAGSGAYERLAENSSNKAYARVALSYIENRVRQGDDQGAIKILQNPQNAKEKALVISGITDIEGEDLWIIQKDNELVEYYVLKDEKVDIDNYLKIGDIESFDVFEMENSIRLEIGYYINEKYETQTRIISLRAGGD